MPSSGAPAAWANGYNGTGVNLAILDGGNVDFTSPDGSECPSSSHNCFLNVYPVSLTGHLGITDHATESASAAASNHATYQGMAPGATIMSAGIPAPGGAQQALTALQWAIDQDADIVNNSFMYCSYGDNLLHNIDKAYDHYARWENKMVVVSSGNHQDVCPYFVTSPAKGWNVVSIGAYIDSYDAKWSNDSMWVDSCYINPASPRNDREKPEVVAPGGVISVIGTNGIIHSGISGTSLAAPHVSGLAALLIDRKTDLESWPVSSRAIIMASAVHNLDGPRGIPTGMELKDGAGGIEASLADKVATTRCTDTQCNTPGWWGLDINNTNFPIGSILERKFPASTGQLVRVAIGWWSDVQCPSIQNCSYDELRTDLDLYIMDPSGNTIVSSRSWDNNYELVEFVAPVRGIYKIRVKKVSATESSNQLGIAWVLTADIYDDIYGTIFYNGNWTHSSGWPRSWQNTHSYSNQAESSYLFNFAGSQIHRVYNMAYNRGTADIIIDGNFVGTTSDDASTTRWQVVKTWSLTPDDHTIEFRVNSGSLYIDLDNLTLDVPLSASGAYDDNSSKLYYIGNWTQQSGWPSAYGGTLSWSNVSEDAVRITFTGSRVDYCYTKTYNRGKAAITIDGVHRGFLDLYSPTTQWQVCTAYSNLGSGAHTFHVSVSGMKNSQSSDYYVDVDKIVISP